MQIDQTAEQLKRHRPSHQLAPPSSSTPILMGAGLTRK